MMADLKLSELTELATTPADNDELYIRDEGETTAIESKKITVANLMAAISTTEDIVGTGVSADTGTTSGGQYKIQSVTGGADYDVATTTDTYAVGSLAVAVAFIACRESTGTDFKKFRLYMDGVQVAESVYILIAGSVLVLSATRALSGSTICKCAVHNYDSTGDIHFGLGGAMGSPVPVPAAIGIGSVKVA